MEYQNEEVSNLKKELAMMKADELAKKHDLPVDIVKIAISENDDETNKNIQVLVNNINADKIAKNQKLGELQKACEEANAKGNLPLVVSLRQKISELNK